MLCSNVCFVVNLCKFKLHLVCSAHWPNEFFQGLLCKLLLKSILQTLYSGHNAALATSKY